MAVNIELQRYKGSKEFQNILAICQNRIQTIQAEIDAIYEEGIQDNKLTKNEFDVKDRWVKDLNFLLSKIKDKKAKELKDHYEYRLKNSHLFLYQPINQIGQSNSILRYTDLDMKRFERSHLYGLEDDIDGLIGIENPEPIVDGAF